MARERPVVLQSLFLTLDGASPDDAEITAWVERMREIVEEGGRREQGHSGGGGRCDYGHFTDAMLESYAAQAVGQALLNLA